MFIKSLRSSNVFAMISINYFRKLVLATLITVLVSCGGESSERGLSGENDPQLNEEAELELSNDNNVTLQGTVLQFLIFQAADGSRNNAQDSETSNYVYLAPFEETFRARYGCNNVSGSYKLNGNSLSLMPLRTDETAACPTAGDAYDTNFEITRQVLAGPSTVSVTDGRLTLTTDHTEALIFVAAEEES